MIPVYIIAEAGVNHNGVIDMAIRMVDEAAMAGADAVKFQTFKTEHLVTAHAPKAEYQKEATTPGESQFSMLKGLELRVEDYRCLMEHCRDRQIDFLSTPFDLNSIDLLANLGLSTWKIPSGEITNLPYLRKIGSRGEHVILSTGMSTMDEIGAALEVLIVSGTTKESITLLHCTTEYPAPLDEVNLKAMLSMREAFGVRVGYSDHTEGIEISIAAAALDAAIIEKHFTLDRNLPGPDHRASLEPDELRTMVRAVRVIEKSLGSGIKNPSPSELKNIAIARKSIVAARDIGKGEIFSMDNLATKRPGTGLSPMMLDSIIGTKAKRDYRADDLI